MSDKSYNKTVHVAIIWAATLTILHRIYSKYCDSKSRTNDDRDTNKDASTRTTTTDETVTTHSKQQQIIINLSNSTNSTSSSYDDLIGNTPMICLSNLSSILKRTIYVKMESMNPSGTGKDRAALAMIQAAEQQHPNGLDVVVEGTSGSTGIALASLCARRNYTFIAVLPDDQAEEKQHLLQALGAQVHIVPNCSISNPNHYVNTARRIASKHDDKACCFINQFENLANSMAHYHTTGPEIYNQIQQQQKSPLHAFVMSCGTGGTLSGVGRYLKEQDPSIQIVLVDPPGSCLYNKIKFGVAYTTQQRERALKRHRYDTIAEGIGLDRITSCLEFGIHIIDDAILVQDQEAIDMAHWILHKEGLFVGSSSAMNLVGAVRTAKQLPPGSTVVTIVCDSGQRHLTRFWNRDFIVNQKGLKWPGDYSSGVLPECLITSD
mmetsp:Transcript_6203/g.9062  ORF Transcript_6203/g.9062 Transcript_6203/m.9062 type:complete len:435 (+) Transcript_6203:55-1359(+)